MSSEKNFRGLIEKSQIEIERIKKVMVENLDLDLDFFEIRNSKLFTKAKKVCLIKKMVPDC